MQGPQYDCFILSAYFVLKGSDIKYQNFAEYLFIGVIDICITIIRLINCDRRKSKYLKASCCILKAGSF